MMKFNYYIILSSVVSLILTGSVFANSEDRQARKAEKQENITKTLATYKACDLTALMTELKAVQLQSEAVFKVSDQIAEGSSYY